MSETTVCTSERITSQEGMFALASQLNNSSFFIARRLGLRLLHRAKKDEKSDGFPFIRCYEMREEKEEAEEEEETRGWEKKGEAAKGSNDVVSGPGWLLFSRPLGRHFI